MTGLIALAAGVAVLAALYFMDRLAQAVMRPHIRPIERTPADSGLVHRDVEIPSGDHVLHGWLLSPDVAADGPLLILAHGWGANDAHLLGLAEPLVVAGHRVLVFNVRGHGRNRPVGWTSVRDFRDDIASAVAWAEAHLPERRRVLIGHSLGGAAGVLAAEAGVAVEGLVLIAAPADVLEVTADYLRDRGLPGGLIVWACRPFWRVRLKESFRDLMPEGKIRDVRLPLLILQPELDRRVHRGHAERLARRSGLPMHLVEGVDHNTVLSAPETVIRIQEFVRNELPATPVAPDRSPEPSP